MTRSRITQFYLGDGPDDRGRLLRELQAQSLEDLERNHDYIQWLFPLPERSSANPRAPVLSPSDVQAFVESDVLRRNLLRSLSVMLRFYGLALSETPGGIEVGRSDTFEQRREVWLTPFNHNFLRITRILRCLRLLGCADYSDALFERLRELYREHLAIIGQETFSYWERAQR